MQAKRTSPVWAGQLSLSSRPQQHQQQQQQPLVADFRLDILVSQNDSCNSRCTQNIHRINRIKSKILAGLQTKAIGQWIGCSLGRSSLSLHCYCYCTFTFGLLANLTSWLIGWLLSLLAEWPFGWLEVAVTMTPDNCYIRPPIFFTCKTGAIEWLLKFYCKWTFNGDGDSGNYFGERKNMISDGCGHSAISRLWISICYVTWTP